MLWEIEINITWIECFYRLFQSIKIKHLNEERKANRHNQSQQNICESIQSQASRGGSNNRTKRVGDVDQ